MRPAPVELIEPLIEIGLQFGNGAIEFLPEGDAVQLVQHRLVEPLHDTIGLGAFGLAQFHLSVDGAYGISTARRNHRRANP